MKGSGLTVAFVAALFAPIEASPRPQQPRATLSVDLAADGWTPKPTPPPRGLIKLPKRQADDDWGEKDGDTSEGNTEGTTVLIAPDNTCGYISGRPGAHFTCPTDYYCALFPPVSVNTGYVGCCDDVDCGVALDCIDFEGYYSSSLCDNGCLVDAFTQKCIDTARPYCNTVSFSEDIYDYWCNSLNISTIQAAATAYAGQDRSFSPLELTDEASSFTLTGGITDGPGATSNPEPTATETDGDGGNDDNGNDSDGDKDGDKDGGDDGGTPIGPIVGGVVGGVGAIGIGGLALWLFFRNKKKKQAAAASAQPSPPVAYAPVQQQPSPPPPGQSYQQQQGFYDPKFVAAGQQYHQQQPQQQQHLQPGGFYTMGNTPPPQSNTSPVVSYVDPTGASSPSTGYPSGFTTHSPTSQGGPQQQGGFIVEAPSRPEETHRGGVHEMS